MSRPYYRDRKKGEAQSFITKIKYKSRSYIGFCKCDTHNGYIAIEALCKHECLEKECPFLHRFNEHPIYNDKLYVTKRIPYKKLLRIKRYIWNIDNKEAQKLTLIDK